MDTCGTCQSDLAPEWKYCVHCGSPVPATDITDLEAIPTLEPIPAAIRPELPATAARRRPDPRLVFGIVMSSLGVVAILYAVVNLLASRG